jgi:uroporphyrinogen decarboxylase
LTGRERVRAAFAHVEADLVPVDVGATASSALEPGACAALRTSLGLSTDVGHEALDEVLDVLEPDLGRVPLGAGGGTALWDGCTVPVRGETPTVRDLERTTWPDPDHPKHVEGLRERAERQGSRGRAVVLDTELGLVDGCQRLRGMTGWLDDLLSAPAFADGLMERVTWVCAGLLRNALRVVGHSVDAVVIYEDLAGQTRLLVSPELYRTRIRRFHAALVDVIRSESPAPAVVHCDGAVGDLLGDFVEIGVQGINPVQTSARGMELDRLRPMVGRNLCLWGACDATRTLVFGTPEQVEAEVETVMRAAGHGGGYVFAPVHPIDASIPPENVLAMVRAARAHGAPR